MRHATTAIRSCRVAGSRYWLAYERDGDRVSHGERLCGRRELAGGWIDLQNVDRTGRLIGHQHPSSAGIYGEAPRGFPERRGALNLLQRSRALINRVDHKG